MDNALHWPEGGGGGVIETPEVVDPLFDQLLAIYAYDSGSTDSGVKDEQLRARLVAELDALSEEELRSRLSRWVASAYLSEKALAQGYGWEDALSFLSWIDTGDYRGPMG